MMINAIHDVPWYFQIPIVVADVRQVSETHVISKSCIDIYAVNKDILGVVMS